MSRRKRSTRQLTDVAGNEIREDANVIVQGATGPCTISASEYNERFPEMLSKSDGAKIDAADDSVGDGSTDNGDSV